MKPSFCEARLYFLFTCTWSFFFCWQKKMYMAARSTARNATPIPIAAPAVFPLELWFHFVYVVDIPRVSL